MSILIKNGTIISADTELVADIYIRESTISSIGSALTFHSDRVIDAAGKLVIPGGIDVHTHLDMPLGDIFSSDDFESGTKAAAFGGTTSIIDFATQSKGKSLRSAFDLWREKAEGKAGIDYGFHMIVTDLPDHRCREMDDLVREGITTFKFFMAYPGVLMVDDETILRALRRSNENGGLVLVHAEDGPAIDVLIQKAHSGGMVEPVYHALTRPPETEAAAIRRTVSLARKADAGVYIVHVSSAGGLQHIREAREKGTPVYGETCPQYLLLSIEDISKPGFEGAKFVFTPPVREKWHQEKLWDGLRTGVLQVVATDHCPFNYAGQKELGKGDFRKIPNGAPGIENRMQVLFHAGVNAGRLSLNRWVDVTSTAPAKLFGLHPRKGEIAVGSDADIVIWNTGAEETISAASHHMRVDYSLYEGMKVRGKPEVVISRGEIIVEGDRWLGKTGRGKFIRRNSLISAVDAG